MSNPELANSFKTSQFFSVCSVLESSITIQHTLDAILLCFIAVEIQRFKIFGRLCVNKTMSVLEVIQYPDILYDVRAKLKDQRRERDSSPCTLARSRFRDGRLTTWLPRHLF